DLGIDVVDRPNREPAPRDEEQETTDERRDDEVQELEVDHDKTTDPVRMYLREMGTVSLLDREGEVAIAQRIEHGEWQIFAALCANTLALDELERLANEDAGDDELLDELDDDDDSGSGVKSARKKAFDRGLFERIAAADARLRELM